MWDWLSLIKYLLRPLLQQRYKQPSSDLKLPGLWDALWQNVNTRSPHHPSLLLDERPPKAAHHPAGQSSAVIRSVWQEWQLLDLLSCLFSLFFLPLFSHSCSVSLFHHELTTLTLQPLGCCQGANSPSALCYACICCLFIPSIFSKYNGGSLVVVLILLVCSHDRIGWGSMSQENIWMAWCQRSDRAEMELLLGG